MKAGTKGDIQQVLAGKSGLLNAPTGSGKTYGLWVPIVLQYIKDNPNYQQTKKPGLKAIWITPLRALSLEIQQATEGTLIVDGQVTEMRA